MADNLGLQHVSGELTAPPGIAQDHSFTEAAARDNSDLLVKRSWDIALDPLKKLPMQAFMVWMVGSQLNLFSIMMVAMMVWQPIQAVFGIKKQLERIRGAQCALQRLVFLLGTLLSLCLALYKFHSMGLLPTHPSDWLAYNTLPKVSNYSHSSHRFKLTN